jgi:TP901 family phage tail tape measure protein
MSVRTDYLNLVVSVNGNAAKKEYSDLKARQAQIVSELKNMRRGTEEYIAKSQELKSVTAQLDEMRGQMDMAALSVKDLRKEISKMRNIRDELDPGSQAFQDMSARIREAEGRLEELRTGTGFVTKAFNFLKSEIASFGALAIGALGINFISEKVGNLIQKNAQLSDTYSDVAKTTGLSAEKVRELNAQLSELRTRTSKRDLLGIAEIGGRLGITQLEELKGFVNAMNQINVALGDQLGDPEEVSRKLGKIVDVFKVKDLYGIEQSLLKAGSAINELGMASTANEGYMVNFANRMGGIAPIARITLPEILALGATLDSFAQTAEVSSTALSKLFVKMTATPEQFARYAGMSAESFSKLIDKNFMEAFIKMLEGVQGNASGMNELVEVLGELNIEGGRVTGVFGVLAENTETLRNQIDISNKAFSEGVSVSNEYALKNENLAAQIERLQKKLMSLWMNDGLQDFLVRAVEHTNTFIAKLSALGKWIQNNATYIKTLIAAYATYRLALAGATANTLRLLAAEKAMAVVRATINFALNVYYAGLILMASKLSLATKAQRALNLVMMQNPYAAVAALIVGLGVALNNLIKKHREAKHEFEKNAIVLKFDFDKKGFEVSKEVDQLRKELKYLYGQKLDITATAISGVVETLGKSAATTAAELAKINYEIEQYEKKVEEERSIKGLIPWMKGQDVRVEYMERYLEKLELERDKTEELLSANESALRQYEELEQEYQAKISGIREEKEARAKELSEEEKKRLQELKEAIQDFERERVLASLTANQREIEAIGDKYAKWLSMTRKFSADYKKLLALMEDEIRAKQAEQDEKILQERYKIAREMVNMVEDEKQKQFESSLSASDREKVQIAKHYEEMMTKLDDALRQKAITEQEHHDYIELLKALHLQQIIALDDKYRVEEENKQAEHLAKKKAFFRELNENPWSDIDPFEMERLRMQAHYDDLEQQAKEHHQKSVLSEQEYADAMKRIAGERSEATIWIEKQEMLSRMQARVEAYGQLADATSQYITMLMSEQRQMTREQKAATFLQISQDTASAISSLVKASEANPANAVTGGAAAALQYAAGLTRIMANIGMAIRVLQSETVPSGSRSLVPSLQQKAEGGYAEVEGRDDQKRYRARLLPRFRQGFLSQPSVVLAGEKGKEYFVSNKMLKMPMVSDIVEGIDALSNGKIKTADFVELLQNTAVMRPYRTGRNPSTGETIEISSPQPPKPAPKDKEEKPNSNREMTQQLKRLNDLLEKGISATAFVGDQTLLDIEKRTGYLKELERQANG